MNNKTLPTGVKTREIIVNVRKQIFSSSPYDTDRKNSIDKYFTKEKIGNAMLYVVCGFLTIVLGYFIERAFNITELINSII